MNKQVGHLLDKKTEVLLFAAISFFLSVSVVLCMELKFRSERISYSLSSIFVYVFCFIISRKAYQVYCIHRERKMLFVSILGGILFSFSLLSGILLEVEGCVFDRTRFEVRYFYIWIGLVVLWTDIIILLFHGLDRWIAKNPIREGEERHYKGAGPFVWNWLAIMAAWLIPLLAYYPGIFAYDASVQAEQVISGTYSTHHPLLHTLLLGGAVNFGHRTGNPNTGLLLYSLMQMGLLSAAFSSAILCMRKKGAGIRFRLASLIFYALFPVNSVLAISATKDVLFAGCVLLLVIGLQCTLPGNKTRGLWGSRIFVIAIGILFLLFRNNAIYALGLYILFPMMLTKERRKDVIKVFLPMLLGYLIVNQSLMMMTKASAGSFTEMLSVPLQQIARVENRKKDGMDKELLERIHFFIPEEVAAEYGECIADGVKDNVNADVIRGNLAEFTKLYVLTGIRYPFTYLDAFLANTRGLWFLEDDTNANIYGSGEGSRLGYLLSNCKAMPEGYQITNRSFLPGVEKWYEVLFSENRYLDVPILSVLFAPAFSFWVLVFCCLYWVWKKEYAKASPFLLLFYYYFTLLLGPTYVIRYMYPILVCVPVVVFSLGEERRTVSG